MLLATDEISRALLARDETRASRLDLIISGEALAVLSNPFFAEACFQISQNDLHIISWELGRLGKLPNEMLLNSTVFMAFIK